MSKIKQFISVLALALAIALPTQIGVQAAIIPAAEPQNYIVTTAKNLNVRDKNCNTITTIGYGNAGNTLDNSNPPINCIINGKSFKMVYLQYDIMAEGYVAEAYTSPVKIRSFTYTDNIVFKVNATAGLNLRDSNCKRITTVKFGTQFKGNVPTDNYPVCNAKGIYYSMQPVYYNNQQYFVASTYIDQIK